MYLHLGQDYIVPLQSVVAVFDMDTATASKRTRLLLERLQDEGRIIELYDDLPRAAVLCENALGETLYLTQLSPQAIQRRAEWPAEKAVSGTGSHRCLLYTSPSPRD